MTDVEGYCPMGCGHTLFLADGGRVTCSHVSCLRPTAVDELLNDRETEHVVDIGERNFTIRHPLRERLDDAFFDCDLHDWLAARNGPPAVLGRYRVPWRVGARRVAWERLGYKPEGPTV